MSKQQTTTELMQKLPIEAISRNEFERLHKCHFFTKDTMQFWKSRIAEYGYKLKNGKDIYFTSSEKFAGEYRVYSLRKMNKNGEITTLDQQLNYLEEAKRAMYKALKQESEK